MVQRILRGINQLGDDEGGGSPLSDCFARIRTCKCECCVACDGEEDPCDLTRHGVGRRTVGMTSRANADGETCAAAMGTGVTQGTDCEHAARHGECALRMHC